MPSFGITIFAKARNRNPEIRACGLACFYARPNPTPAIIANSRQNRGRGDSAFPLKLLFTDKAVPAASRFSCFARITDGPVRFRARHVCLFWYAVERGTRADPRSLHHFPQHKCPRLDNFKGFLQFLIDFLKVICALDFFLDLDWKGFAHKN